MRINEERRNQKQALQPEPTQAERVHDLQARNEESALLIQINDHDLDLKWIHQKLSMTWEESNYLLKQTRNLKAGNAASDGPT